MARHLAIKAWCPCKDAKWTIEDAVRGQTDGRSNRSVVNQAVAGDQSTIFNTSGNNNNIFNITLQVPAGVLPSGSDAERAYLLANAEAILKGAVADCKTPEADILSRFVRETWCSDEHSSLNNVLSLKSSNLEFIRLCQNGGRARIETLAGKEAPAQLVEIAQKLLVQLAKDTCSGYNPAWYTTPFFDRHHEDRSGAETEHDNYGRGVVRQLDDGTWINDRSANPPPSEDPRLLHEASMAAGVPRGLENRRREKRRVERVVTSQLQQVPDKRDKRRKLLTACAKGSH